MQRRTMIATFSAVFALQCLLLPWPLGAGLVCIAFVMAFVVTGVSVAAVDLRLALARPVAASSDTKEQHSRGHVAAL